MSKKKRLLKLRADVLAAWKDWPCDRRSLKSVARRLERARLYGLAARMRAALAAEHEADRTYNKLAEAIDAPWPERDRR